MIHCSAWPAQPGLPALTCAGQRDVQLLGHTPPRRLIQLLQRETKRDAAEACTLVRSTEGHVQLP